MKPESLNNIKITDFLNKAGLISEVEKHENYILVKSPFRANENKPSFKISLNKNLWIDFGTGAGGTLIDFVMQYHNCNFKEASQIIKQTNQIETKELFLYSHSTDSESKLEIKHVQPIQNIALIQYLQKRKIALPLAKMYLIEAYYNVSFTNNDGREIVKNYFALAFKNNSGGYELRNKFDNGKKTASPKDITTIPAPNGNGINIFEGFFDFLSALTYYGIDKPTQTTIILNSTANIKRAVPELVKFSACNAFLDNDKSGLQTFETVQSIIPKAKNRANEIYPAYKDFNEYLCSVTK